MKKTIKKEVHCCDKCGKEASYPEACMKCGTEMCYECKQKHGKSYNHAVYFQGICDGFYCNWCDAKLTAYGTDKQHNAYLAIKRLRLEADAWSENFKMRQQEAEGNLRKFIT